MHVTGTAGPYGARGRGAAGAMLTRARVHCTVRTAVQPRAHSGPLGSPAAGGLLPETGKDDARLEGVARGGQCPLSREGVVYNAQNPI